MTLHRTCCCGGEASRYWLEPSCGQTTDKVAVFQSLSDCNLTPNTQVYEFSNGFAGPEYCGVLKRESDVAIPNEYIELLVDSGDCQKFTATSCLECGGSLCGLWEDCQENDGITVDVFGYSGGSAQFPDDGFGENTDWNASVTAVAVGQGTFATDSIIGDHVAHPVTITFVAELTQADGFCNNEIGTNSTYCNKWPRPLQPQTWTWDVEMTLRVTCDGGDIVDDWDGQGNGPQVCPTAVKTDSQGLPTDYYDSSAWYGVHQTSDGTSTLGHVNNCLFNGFWSVTARFQVGCSNTPGDVGEETRWAACFGNLGINPIEVTITGNYYS